MLPLSMLSYGILGGFLPALVWIVFWLWQDRLHPEPRRLLLLSFIAGMIAVMLALPIERFFLRYSLPATTLLLIWVAVEELLKYGAARITVLWRCNVDEPIDPVIYLITAALGFAALENVLFILGPLSSGDVTQSVLTGNFRFIGATLLHVLASATVGIALAFSFYKSQRIRKSYVFAGLMLAFVLHALYNLSIIENTGSNILITFSFVWVGIGILLFLLERVKRIPRPSLPTQRIRK